MLANRMQMAAAAKRKTIEFVADSFSTGATIQIPNEVQDGDVGFLFQVHASINTDSDVTPSGWSSISGMSDAIDLGSNAHRASVKYRVLDADDAGDFLTGLNGDVDYKRIVVFRPNFLLDNGFPSPLSPSTTRRRSPPARTRAIGLRRYSWYLPSMIDVLHPTRPNPSTIMAGTALELTSVF